MEDIFYLAQEEVSQIPMARFPPCAWAQLALCSDLTLSFIKAL